MVSLVLHGRWHKASREHIDSETEVVGLADCGCADHLAQLILGDPPHCEFLPK